MLSSREQAILRGVLRDRERLAAMDWHAGGLPTARQRGAHRVKILDAQDWLCG